MFRSFKEIILLVIRSNSSNSLYIQVFHTLNSFVFFYFTVKPPTNGIDSYVHRSGRTGRAGREGLSIMLHSGSYDEKKIIHEVCIHFILIH